MAFGLGAVHARAAVVRRRDRLAQLRAADAGRAARKGRAGRVLHVLVRQLAAHPSVRPRLGRAISRPRAGGDRRAHAGVRVRARRREDPRSPRGDGRPVPDRGRQRLRRLAGLRQQLLARPLLRGCRGAATASPLRRGGLRRVGEGHSAAADRSRGHRGGCGLVSVDAGGVYAPADWDTLGSPETYVGLRPGGGLCVSGRPGARPQSRLRGASSPWTSTTGRSQETGRSEHSRPS